MWIIPILVVVAIVVAIYITYGFVAGLRIDITGMSLSQVAKAVGKNTLKGFFAPNPDKKRES